MRQKPRLTKTVRDGLISMANHIEAGACDDFTGYAEEDLDTEQREEWKSVQAACEWIFALRAYHAVPKLPTCCWPFSNGCIRPAKYDMPDETGVRPRWKLGYRCSWHTPKNYRVAANELVLDGDRAIPRREIKG